MGIWQLLVVVKALNPYVARHLCCRYLVPALVRRGAPDVEFDVEAGVFVFDKASSEPYCCVCCTRPPDG